MHSIHSVNTPHTLSLFHVRVPYRVYDAKTDGKVVLIPPKDPNTFKIVCDFACQASTTFSNEDCFSSKSNPKDPLKGLVTVRHRGLACEEKGCESSSCKKEVGALLCVSVCFVCARLQLQ
jgi:hypothetical protein